MYGTANPAARTMAATTSPRMASRRLSPSPDAAGCTGSAVTASAGRPAPAGAGVGFARASGEVVETSISDSLPGQALRPPQEDGHEGGIRHENRHAGRPHRADGLHDPQGHPGHHRTTDAACPADDDDDEDG